MSDNLIFTGNPEQTEKLRNAQALLGTATLRDTANMLMSLGNEVLLAASQGGQVAIIDDNAGTEVHLKHPVLENLKRILSEKD